VNYTGFNLFQEVGFFADVFDFLDSNRPPLGNQEIEANLLMPIVLVVLFVKHSARAERNTVCL
jgi:hypothetical protein